MKTLPKEGKLVRLSQEQVQSLTETPIREALHIFVDLADLRNKSGSSPRQIIPYPLRKEAEKTRANSNYQPAYR